MGSKDQCLARLESRVCGFTTASYGLRVFTTASCGLRGFSTASYSLRGFSTASYSLRGCVYTGRWCPTLSDGAAKLGHGPGSTAANGELLPEGARTSPAIRYAISPPCMNTHATPSLFAGILVRRLCKWGSVRLKRPRPRMWLRSLQNTKRKTKFHRCLRSSRQRCAKK